jgi:hypothetical protein
MPSSSLLVLPVVAGGLAALGCLIPALGRLRRKRLIDDMPTSKTQGVFLGLTELKGWAESEAPLTSHLAGVSCVQYAWRVEEQYTRTVVETYTDSRGRTHTRTRRETHWQTVASDGQSAPFHLKDDTGVIRIVPDHATIEGVTVLEKSCTPSDALYFGKGPAQEVANSDHRRRFRETAIPLHTTLYVMGQARERQDVVAAEVTYDKQVPMFLISTHTEKQVSTREHRWFWFWVVLGLLLIIAGVIVRDVLEPFSPHSRPLIYAATIGSYLLVLALGWVWMVYNSLIGLNQRVQQAWSQVDVQLKRRSDLIPNLVQAVEGYRSHEREVQELVAGLRGQLAATPPGVAGPDYRGFAPALRIVAERYPDLKASELFLKLQQTLSDIEQRIALARDYFNEIATFYNIRLLIIPDRFVASSARLRPRLLIGASDFERAEVNVRLVD